MSDGVTDADLAGLPPAQIIEELGHQAIVDRKVAVLQELWAAEIALDPTLPAMDTLHLHSDPSRKLIEESGYSEIYLRARINDAARANLLYYAGDGDVEHIGFDHDVLRMPGESLAQFKSRIVLATAGRSPAGPAERFEAIARGADVRVASARAYRVGRDPTIYIAIYSTDSDGVADDALVATVQAAVSARSVEPANATVVVRAAVFAVVNVTFDLWLLPDAPASLIDSTPETLRTAWEAARAMGKDFVAEWAQAQLTVPGVYKAVLTSPTVVAEPYQALSLGTVTPAYRGRAF